MIIKYSKKFLDLSQIPQFSVIVDRPNPDVYQVIIGYGGKSIEMDKFLDEKDAIYRAEKIEGSISTGLTKGLAFLALD